MKALGPIDVLFVNADLKRFQPMNQVTEDSFDESFEVNVRGRSSHYRKRYHTSGAEVGAPVNAGLPLKGGPWTSFVQTTTRSHGLRLVPRHPRRPDCVQEAEPREQFVGIRPKRGRAPVISLARADDKLAQINRRSPSNAVDLGMPSTTPQL